MNQREVKALQAAARARQDGWVDVKIRRNGDSFYVRGRRPTLDGGYSKALSRYWPKKKVVKR